MFEKHPSWSRVRVGRGRVRWVAYDDRVGAEGSQVVAEGYAASLPEADSAARAALAGRGMYQARRASTASRSADRGDRPKPDRSPSQARERPRGYLYTRRHVEGDEAILVAAHLILKKTAKRVYVTRKSIGPDQLGTEDERWDDNEPAIALDRLRLERDGSVYNGGHRLSDFYATRDAAMGDSTGPGPVAFRRLGLRPPCSVEDIKSAYRRKAMEVHPDRGGNPDDFQAIEAAYRQLIREARSSDA